MSSPQGRAFLVTMSPEEIRKELARALDQRTQITLKIVGVDSGSDEITFRVGTTNHSPSSSTLDLIIGYTDKGETVQVTIPTSDTPTLVIRPGTT